MGVGVGSTNICLRKILVPRSQSRPSGTLSQGDDGKVKIYHGVYYGHVQKNFSTAI